ncbi:GSCFA domain-containing protein [Winogradskyella alexanderae]|uniref:GSCFA domain-containing protein n=1 Tax=Winogradskyella alexanderae TaxID=2877123 RepID=A0ABS7XS98_9FLAO|nr:GSCFA domain-containing protein [Winogradskyella alexanderae]MCA0132905.1 GSCFA domain-containing protein [Winogradskyella alexanderae]
MKLQTIIPLESQKHNLIDYNSNILMIGSCFSENIGEKFEYLKFKTYVNPFGILFNPVSIENLITRAINLEYYQMDEFINRSELWFCLDAHSSLNQASEEDLLITLNQALNSTNAYLKEATHVIITLGTSWVYRFLESDKIVANCHKLPQKQFLKEIMEVDAITQSLQAIIAQLKSINQSLNVVFTVSPVRHLKDGFVENMRSKSHLINAIHNCIDPRQRVYYFPSFELMMDELRDYRFYNEDMVHPNQLAINYIWEKFQLVWISDESKTILNAIQKIQNKLGHKAFNPKSAEHKKFLNQLQEDINTIRKKYPHISFD